MNSREQGAKGEETRQRILRAAREVFTTTPYHRAGIREIAGKAGVRHPLVLHYFGSKAALFDAVTLALEREILDHRPLFFDALRKLTPAARRRFFIEGVMRQGFMHPDPYTLLLVNAGEAWPEADSPPGLERMLSVHEKTLAIAREHLFGQAPDKEADRYMLVFTLMVSHLVGARAFHRNVLGLTRAEYEQWAAGVMILVFDPLIQAIARGDFPRMPEWGRAPAISDAGTPLPQPGPADRGDLARRRVLDAARRVFSTYSYDVATIRMIGRAGRFDFSRIHHLFPTKADLFEAVARDAFTDFVNTARRWRRDLSAMPGRDVFLHYLKNGLDYCFENREALGLLLRNIANYERFESLKGFVHMARVHSRILAIVRESLPPGAPFDDLGRWLYAIVIAGYSLAGAPAYAASLLHAPPLTSDYRRQVMETIYFAFYPSLAETTGRLGGKAGKA